MSRSISMDRVILPHNELNSENQVITEFDLFKEEIESACSHELTFNAKLISFINNQVNATRESSLHCLVHSVCEYLQNIPMADPDTECYDYGQIIEFMPEILAICKEAIDYIYDEDETINESLVEVDDQLYLFDLDNDPHPF